MFGTFRYNRNTNDHEHVEISRADGVEARGFTRVACNSCRDRKVSYELHQNLQIMLGPNILSISSNAAAKGQVAKSAGLCHKFAYTSRLHLPLSTRHVHSMVAAAPPAAHL